MDWDSVARLDLKILIMVEVVGLDHRGEGSSNRRSYSQWCKWNLVIVVHNSISQDRAIAVNLAKK